MSENIDLEDLKKDGIIIIKNEDGIFLIIQEFNFEVNDDLINFFKEIKNEKENNNKLVTIIFDINKLSKNFQQSQREQLLKIIETIQNSNKNNEEIYEDNNLRIIFKNCLIEGETNLYFSSEKLILNLLYISDELYSMTPNLNSTFSSFQAKTLILKKIKINSKFQLENFFEFIAKSRCEELLLEDIFIELIIINDEDYNQLDKYFFFENGIIKVRDYENIRNIKKIKMIDCPLFAIKKDTFKKIKDNKDISIDIDENSLINPSIITKFKINNGYTDICFDLDSYKIHLDKELDYTEYIKYIFDILIDENYNYNKIKFKNFDVTKFEYISGENLTFIEEKNWILNKEEKERKERFEKNEEEINKIIENNLDKLLNIKELIFDNCSNHFIKLILKLISKKEELEYLKIKKCGKEYFDLSNILSLKIKNLILFDTPLIIDHFRKTERTHLGCFKGTLGKIDNLTININNLEHYCISNNLDYYRTIEIIVELINNESFNQNLCFEMDALPVIMTFLAAKLYNKKRKDKYIIPENFNFQSLEKRKEFIEQDESPFILKGLENKTITIKRHYIKNYFENFYVISSHMKKEESQLKEQKLDFGRDYFDLDIDYKTFFIKNGLKCIIFKEDSYSNNFPLKIKEDLIISPFITLLRALEDDNTKEFKIDIKSLNDAIYRNNYGDFACLYRDYITTIKREDVNSDQLESFKALMNFVKNLKNIFEQIKKYNNKLTFIFNNLKEKKQFYCLLCFLREVKKEVKYHEKALNLNGKKYRFMVPDKNNDIKKNLNSYFIMEKNEEQGNIPCEFNYYYTNKEEMELFGDEEINKDITFDEYKFKIEYICNSKNTIYEKGEIKNKLFNQMIFE